MKEEEALVRVVRVVCGSRNSKGVSAIDSNRETHENHESLYGLFFCSCRSRCSRFKKFKGSVRCSPEAVRGRVQGEGFPSPPGWEPRAVKEEALVLAVRVVRGS